MQIGISLAAAVGVLVGASCGSNGGGAGLSLSYTIREAPQALAAKVTTIVDDRRVVDVAADGSFALTLLDRDVALADVALDVEGGVGPCARDADGATVVRCQGARPGARLVHATYPTDDGCVRIGHVIDADLDDQGRGQATVTTKVAMCTPVDGRAAMVRILVEEADAGLGLHEIAAAQVALTGDVEILSPPPVALAARLEATAFGGAIIDGTAAWETPRDVLVLEPAVGAPPAPNLLRAPTLVTVRSRGTVRTASVDASALWQPVPSSLWPSAGGGLAGRGRDEPVAGFASERTWFGSLRVVLWPSAGLSSRWDRWVHSSDERGVTSESRMVGISATSDAAPRDVWVEAGLPRPGVAGLVDYFPGAPEVVGHTARLRLRVAPGQLVRAGFQVDSDP